MFGLEKVVVVCTTLAALAVPSLAMADDYDHRDRRDDRAIAVLRAEIDRDRVELQRDEYNHRWEKAREERREIERRENQLRDLLRHRYRR